MMWWTVRGFNRIDAEDAKKATDAEHEQQIIEDFNQESKESP